MKQNGQTTLFIYSYDWHVAMQTVQIGLSGDATPTDYTINK